MKAISLKASVAGINVAVGMLEENLVSPLNIGVAVWLGLALVCEEIHKSK